MWLKFVYLLVVLPAWLVGGYCVLTGRNESVTAYAAAGVFGACTLLYIIFDRRRLEPEEDSGLGIDIG